MNARGQRFKGGGAPAIARFLADHQRCDAGFDVLRDEAGGGGRVRIRCEGCRQSVGYRVSAADDLAISELADFEAGRDRGDRPVAPASGEPGAGPQRSGTYQTASRRRLVVASLTVLAALVLGLVAFAALRSGDSDSSSAPETVAGPSGAIAPPSSAPVPPEPGPVPDPGSLRQTRTQDGVVLRPQEFSGRFSIGVPKGWAVGEDEDKAEVLAPGESAAITVFFGSSDLSPIEFARQSELFLAQRHEGSEVGPVYPAKLKGRAVARVRVSYDEGEEVGTFFSRAGTSFVLLKRVEADASPRLQREAVASLLSFTPS